MVGINRSQGCILCVKRRVKCDETKPSCTNCVRYNAQCPGYQRDLKFVNVKHKRGPNRRNNTNKLDSSLSSSHSISLNNAPAVTFSHELRYDPSEYVSTLIQSAETNLPKDQTMMLGAWIQRAIPKLGNKVMLDSAIAALALRMLGIHTKDDTLLCQSRSVYGRSLHELQRALNHPKEWSSSESRAASTTSVSIFKHEANHRVAAFCATILNSQFEVSLLLLSISSIRLTVVFFPDVCSYREYEKLGEAY